MTVFAILLISLFVATASNASDVEYRTGGPEYADTWHRFYVEGFHEPELDDPLIERGESMVPAICTAVRHKDMKYRRYAIGALGFIGSRAALPTLVEIVKDRKELDFFRGDALHSTYQIDRQLGKRLAVTYRADNEYLKMLGDAVLKDDPWLLEDSSE